MLYLRLEAKSPTTLLSIIEDAHSMAHHMGPGIVVNYHDVDIYIDAFSDVQERYAAYTCITNGCELLRAGSLEYCHTCCLKRSKDEDEDHNSRS